MKLNYENEKQQYPNIIIQEWHNINLVYKTLMKPLVVH